MSEPKSIEENVDEVPKSRFRRGNAKRGADAIARGFRERGFDQRVIAALTSYGIDAPERLLFMRDDTLRKIRGVGKAGFEQIRRYQNRFLGSEVEQHR